MASPDGTRVPPAASITDNNGDVWTLDDRNHILQNGNWAGGGIGSPLTWCGGVVRVLAGLNWYAWTGSSWNPIGTTDPCAAIKIGTTTTLASSANPSTAGQSVTLTATVNPVSGSGLPTGTVTFKDGATTLGTGTLNASKQATFTTSALTAATHSLTAVYGGDAGFNTSTSAALSQVVNQQSTGSVFTRTANGLVPAPGGSGTTRFLREDATWQTGPVGPAGPAGPQGSQGPIGPAGPAGPAGGTFSDALSDGQTYGRKNGTWVTVGVPGAGMGPSDWLDVTNFGADPSGGQDSVPAFERALAAGRIYENTDADHGTIYIPRGDFDFSRPLMLGVGNNVGISRQVKFQGAGANGQHATGSRIFGSFDNFLIHRPENNPTSAQIIFRDIFMHQMSNGAGAGCIRLSGTFMSKVEDCAFLARVGVSLTQSLGPIAINNCQFDYGGSWGDGSVAIYTVGEATSISVCNFGGYDTCIQCAGFGIGIRDIRAEVCGVAILAGVARNFPIGSNNDMDAYPNVIKGFVAEGINTEEVGWVILGQGIENGRISNVLMGARQSPQATLPGGSMGLMWIKYANKLKVECCDIAGGIGQVGYRIDDGFLDKLELNGTNCGFNVGASAAAGATTVKWLAGTGMQIPPWAQVGMKVVGDGFAPGTSITGIDRTNNNISISAGLTRALGLGDTFKVTDASGYLQGQYYFPNPAGIIRENNQWNA